jgi:hypothetical protein
MNTLDKGEPIVATIKANIKAGTYVDDCGALDAHKVRISNQDWIILRRELATRDAFAREWPDLIDALAAGKTETEIETALREADPRINLRTIRSVRSVAKDLGLVS